MTTRYYRFARTMQNTINDVISGTAQVDWIAGALEFSISNWDQLSAIQKADVALEANANNFQFDRDE